MNTKVYNYEITEGEHSGHHVVTDAWGIDHDGRDPKTAGYCLDCKEEVEIYPLDSRPEKAHNITS